MFKSDMRVAIIFALVLAGLTLIGGCSQQVTCNKPYILVGTGCCLDKNGNDICDNDEIQSSETEDSEKDLVEAIEPKTNSVSCEDIVSKTEREQCYESLAVEKQDPDICDKIGDKSVKDGCYYRLAKDKQDLTICKEIFYAATHDKCYWDLAVEKMDEDICDNLVDSRRKAQCYAAVLLS